MEKLDDPLERIFENVKEKEDNSLKLFEEGDIHLKSQLSAQEHVLLTALEVENRIINRTFPEFDLFTDFIKSFLRNKVSLDRQSRTEFVNVNMKNILDKDLNRMSNLKNLTEARN